MRPAGLPLKEPLRATTETYFASLCAHAGVICNSPDEDENGGDFFLQFPAQRTLKRPADMQPAGPEAFVQVKSSRRPPFDVRIKLSNALRAVQGTQPFFLDHPTRAAVYIAACTVGDWSFLTVVERNSKSDDLHDGRRSLIF